ncbi:sulfotransferase family 2 domain-containing protein [Vibrio splendidus]
MLRKIRQVIQMLCISRTKGSLDKAEYFVIDDLKLVYIVNSKVACSSIKKTMYKYLKGEVGNISHYSDIHYLAKSTGKIKTRLSKKEMGYDKFTFVRDPFKRMVSLYENKFLDNEKIIDSPVKFAYKDYLGGCIKREISFPEFVRIISKIPDKYSERHFKSQSYLIEENMVNDCQWMKLEEIKDAWLSSEILSSLEMPERENRSSSYDYREFYDIETLQLLYDRYQKDIVKFGYYSQYEELKEHIYERSNINN